MNIDLNIEYENVVSDEDNPNQKDDRDELVESNDELSCDDESIACELEKRFEVGNIVESPEQVYLLYCEYGRRRGFSVRKGDQTYFSGSNLLHMKEFDCSCEGRHDDKRSRVRLAAYKKQLTRTGCKAGIRIVRKRDGPWKVQEFIEDHNHEMLAVDQRHLLRSARHLTHAHQSLLEALNSASIGVSRACRFLEKEAGGPQNIGFTRKDAYNYLNHVKVSSSVDSVDANSLVQFFVKKSNEEPFFYWNVQVDDDGRLMNFFFRDSRALVDYEYFGDVLSVDTTYKTNIYNLICAPFVGINHHMRNVMFGLAFLSNETTTSFKWMFSTFLESMHGREPRVIFTNQSQPLINGIDLTFRTASHRLCQWHIARNTPSHFGALNLNSEFRKNWYYCMNGVESEVEFEQCWQSMIRKFRLVENRWFSGMYKLRKRWASVFTNNTFSAGLLATSRSEVTNKVLKYLCNARCSLIEIVQKFEQIQLDWRTRERVDDASNVGSPGQFVSNSLLLSQASKVYTRNVYKIFEAQLALAVTVAVIGNPVYGDDGEMRFRVASQPLMRRIRCVHFNRVSHEATCSCRMWETEGILCRHIFRVYLAMNVMKFPECYILSRWTTKANERHLNDGGKFCNSKVGDVVGEMSFVSYIMRMMLELANNVKDQPAARKLICNRIVALKNELTSSQNGGDKGSIGQQWSDIRPPRARKRGRSPSPNLQSHWSKKKDKAQRRSASRPKWPDVECSQQSESTRDQSADSRLRSPSISAINTQEKENEVFGTNSQFSQNENLEKHIDVTSIFQRHREPTIVFKTQLEAFKAIFQLEEMQFYQPPWTREVDLFCLSHIHFLAFIKQWRPEHDERNLRCLPLLQRELASKKQIDISLELFEARVATWRRRYEIMSWLINFAGIESFCMYNKTVNISEEAWAQIEQLRPDVLVYKDEGEEGWHILKAMFKALAGNDEAYDYPDLDGPPLDVSDDDD